MYFKLYIKVKMIDKMNGATRIVLPGVLKDRFSKKAEK